MGGSIRGLKSGLCGSTAGRKVDAPDGREPNGRPRRKHLSERQRASLQPHRRSLPAFQRLSQHAENPFGRMFLSEQITRPQYLGGEKLAGIVSTYCRMIGAPCPNAHGIPLEGISHGQQHFTPEERQRIKGAYDGVYEALENAVGVRRMRVVNRTAVWHRPCDDMDALRVCLNALAKHFGYDVVERGRVRVWVVA